MNRIFTSLAACLFAATGFAQLTGDGYYRVQNTNTQRYIRVIDDYGKVNVTSTTADMGALKTIKYFENVVSDPSSIIYFKKEAEGYNLKAQGTSLFDIIHYYVKIWDNGDNTYKAYAVQTGVTIYLNDEVSRRVDGVVGSNDASSRDWYITPVNQNDNQYFGITPDITIGNDHYKSFFAAFPFSFASGKMNAYYVTLVDKKKGVAVYEDVNGSVPERTPVIIKCGSTEPANNKLNLMNYSRDQLTGNKLTGVYFCNPDAGPLHTNVVEYDAATMRVLGTTADGSLGYVTPADLKYVPANTAYLTVDADAPAELKLVTPEEYANMKTVTITAQSYSREYGEENPTFEFTADADYEGTPEITCEATAGSPVGTYDIKVAQGSVTGATVIGVSGKLTVTKATLTVKADDAERVEGEENPAFTLTYSGFKNNENESVLLQAPVATTTATAESPAGEYAIVVSGGEAQNYSFAYVNGTLTVKPAQGISTAAVSGRVFDVYTVLGNKIRSAATTLEGLPKGIYVVNNRKVQVR